MAESAEFFSFGTNDLTQTTFGISRDDAEAGFLMDYIRKGILADNPFETIDPDGVGRLMQIAVEDGRSVRPDIEVGPGDAIFTSPFTFIATAEVVSMLGASPVLVAYMRPRTPMG